MFLQLTLGIVFIAAGLTKIFRQKALLPFLLELKLHPPLARIVALIVPWLELGIGVALASGLQSMIVPFASVGLSLMFTFTLAVALQTRTSEPCHCFGSWDSGPVSAIAIMRSILLSLATVSLLVDRSWNPVSSSSLVDPASDLSTLVLAPMTAIASIGSFLLLEKVSAFRALRLQQGSSLGADANQVVVTSVGP